MPATLTRRNARRLELGPTDAGNRVGVFVNAGIGVAVMVGKVGVVVGNENVGRGVFVGIALCGSASPVLTVDMAVSMISASLIFRLSE